MAVRRLLSWRGFLLVTILAVLLGAFLVTAFVANAQTDCQGPDCEVTDICDGPGCPPNPGDEDSGSNPGGQTETGDVGPGCSVSEIPEEGDGATCSLYCRDDRIDYVYLESERIWVAAGATINGEMDFERPPGSGFPICNWTFAEEPPCTTITITPSGEITCGGNFSVSASARVPCMTVLRDPYPRGLVSAPNVFWLNGPWSAIGSASSRAWCTPTIRNYTLQVGWQFLPGVPPAWFFDERSWSEEPPYAYGMAVTHTYQTSSWGLPETGPSLEGKLNLPAYQVRVGTAWQAMVRRSWEELERGDRRTFNCDAGDTECWELYAVCEVPGTDLEDDQCYEWRWVARDTGWVPVDLTQYGYAQSYYLSWAAGDVSMPPPGVPAVPLSQRLCNVPVPIIEAQALLNSPGNSP